MALTTCALSALVAVSLRAQEAETVPEPVAVPAESPGWKEVELSATHAGGEALFFPRDVVSSEVTHPVTVVTPDPMSPG